eukprot:CAMPEP_0178465670 /NCGR_PEP_ID=MMETSP0689_2-20121128/51484_1 /TAXON_ID=160604 /ORGANISM="Amphidinium massartii, Strain CS-259" /LENGTH=1352 /DNA_ID=CAMNT_0020092623 /DNA_START=215 /DNA_END=4273 /DNA_ORIENTATION=+
MAQVPNWMQSLTTLCAKGDDNAEIQNVNVAAEHMDLTEEEIRLPGSNAQSNDLRRSIGGNSIQGAAEGVLYGKRRSNSGLASTGIPGLFSSSLWQRATSTKSALRDVPNQKDACCLAWTLTEAQHAQVQEPDLIGLHNEIQTCLGLFKAVTLLEDATTGIIMGFPVSSHGMTAEDAMVRFGQLLCRWAAAHSIGLRIGIHAGMMYKMESQSSQTPIFWGDAINMARQLAALGVEEFTYGVVRLSRTVKDRLSALKHVQFGIATKLSSFYLEPTVEIDLGKTGSDSPRSTTTLTMMNNMQLFHMNSDKTKSLGEDSVVRTTLEDFTKMLKKHGVNTSQFGRGASKTLAEFYDDVVIQQKSLLSVKEGMLHRVVSLVRISLRVRDEKNKSRELRIFSQATREGGMRDRNQRLAMVLKAPEHQKWQEAVERCFESKFGIAPKVQKACFSLDMDSYSFKEEESTSATIPGIATTYKAHSIVVNITDKKKKDLSKMGLPAVQDFTMEHGGVVSKWTWAALVDENEEELQTLLQTNGIDVTDFSPFAFAELYEEIYEKKLSTLAKIDGELVRTIAIVKVWLHATILHTDHLLVTNGKFQKGRWDSKDTDRPVSMRMNADQDLEEAVQEALQLRLGIDVDVQKEHLRMDISSHKIVQETAYSRTFPGLKTCYVMSEIDVVVNNPKQTTWAFLGLPDGLTFSLSRKETTKSGETDMVTTRWRWAAASDLGQEMRRRSLGVAPRISDESDSDDDDDEEMKESVKRRAPLPEPLPKATDVQDDGTGIAILEHHMKDRKVDWDRARNCVANLRKESYTWKHFFADLSAAFPELRLYYIKSDEPGQDAASAAGQTTTAGRSADDEYQRTIGALFAVFWLMRMDLDGKESFCFGVETSSKSPCKARDPAEAFKRNNAELGQRQAFYKGMKWETFVDLFTHAGLMTKDGGYDEERTMAMIVLLVIHDIMKLDDLRPVVAPSVGDFQGYKVGETIGDHDIALSYVLMNYPQVLPSFHGLPKRQQEAIKFSQCKMEYNMGWLVQAEAPPRALLRTLRQVVVNGKAAPQDVAFYFVHWFADLAGAEPCPLEGCEKFVLRFPLRVLLNFVDSMQVVHTLSAAKSETQVFEEYLLWRWQHHTPPLAEPPSGIGSIARMRLIVMAQGNSEEMLSQYSKLPEEERCILSEEMAMTGLKGQQYARDSLKDTPQCGRGPAFLIYYGPALMQKAGKTDPYGAMRVLAEVYRAARELWPLSEDAVEKVVTIRIDALKVLEVKGILVPEAGNSWVMEKSNEVEGTVKLMPIDSFKKIEWAQNRLLTFGRAGPYKMKGTKGSFALRLGAMLPKWAQRRPSMSEGARGFSMGGQIRRTPT